MIQSIKLLDWEYILKKNSPMEFAIKQREEIETPSKLMKYYKVNKYSIDALINNYFYASHPFELNDPFDCFHRLINFDEITFDTYLKFLVDQCGNPIEKVEKLFHEDIDTLKQLFIKLFYEWIFTKLGIVSLTTRDLDILMWAHYSNHNGFLIVFDVNLLNQFHGPFPINYVDKAESIDINTTQILSILYLTNIKSKCWSYEDEWRLLYESKKSMKFPTQPDDIELTPRKASYLQESIKEIVLGFDFFQDKAYIFQKEGFYYFDLTKSTESTYRIKLINYIINTGLKVSLIQMHNELEFKLQKNDILLNKIDKTIFGYKLIK